eukprot:154498_1
MYSYRLRKITDNTALALTASILSMTASILSYWIERNPSDTKVVEYYLTTECRERIVLIDDEVENTNKNDETNKAQITTNGGEEENTQIIEANIANIAGITN